MLTLYDLAESYCHDDTIIIVGNAHKYGTEAVLSDPCKIPPEMWDLRVRSWGLVLRPSEDISMEDIMINATIADAEDDALPFE